MRRFSLIIVLVLAVSVSWALVQGDDNQSPRKETLDSLMRVKLASSEKILEGLVTKDFVLIEQGAVELRRVCDAEQWLKRSDDVYTHHRTELRKLADKLAKLSQDQNLEGAGFTYMSAVSTCIHCHEYSRDILKIANFDQLQSPTVALHTPR